MKEITATELQLLGCFGVEPFQGNDGVPWYFTGSEYKVELDGMQILFSIYPAAGDVGLVVMLEERPIFHFSAMDVSDVRLIDEPKIDAVVIEMSNDCWMKVQLRPAFQVLQGYKIGKHGQPSL